MNSKINQTRKVPTSDV